MSNTIDFEQQDKEYIANTYGRFNVCFEKGRVLSLVGCRLVKNTLTLALALV